MRVDFPKMSLMSFFSDKIADHLNRLNEGRPKKERLTAYKVALEVGLDPSLVTNVFNGKKGTTRETFEKIAKSQSLGLPIEILLAWRAIDDYQPAELTHAIDILRQEGSL